MIKGQVWNAYKVYGCIGGKIQNINSESHNFHYKLMHYVDGEIHTSNQHDLGNGTTVWLCKSNL